MSSPVPTQIPSYNNSYDDLIGLRELLIMMWKGKITILLVTVAAAALSVFIALSQPNFYTSTALLAPASDSGSGGMSRLSSQYSSIASLAGISLGSGPMSSVGLGLEVIKSRAFIVDFIARRDVLVPLFAMKSWNSKSGEIVINKNVYDQKSKTWLGVWADSRPSDQQAYEKFIQLMSVSQNNKTGLVSVSIIHESPVLAQQLATWLVEDINAFMKNRDVAEARSSIIFLQREIESTHLAELKEMFFTMIQEQTKTVMLANVRTEYLFRMIDPAIIPERKTGPIRWQICILGTLIGGVLAAIIVFLRRFGLEIIRGKKLSNSGPL